MQNALLLTAEHVVRLPHSHMSLALGTRLGPYVVAAQIGQGGMGEVYHATDTNLKRTVAIKVLPEDVAGDPDRLARFQREAEVLAALNHPNIAQIYGLERSAGVTALVMELVDGPTLAELIDMTRGTACQSIRRCRSPGRLLLLWRPHTNRALSTAISSPRTSS